LLNYLTGHFASKLLIAFKSLFCSNLANKFGQGLMAIHKKEWMQLMNVQSLLGTTIILEAYL